MGKTKTKSRSVGDSPKPPITIRSTNVKILDDNIAKLEKAIQAGDVSANPSGTAEETLLSTIGIDGKKYELGPSAENTSYNNTDSGLTADNVQAAIDEVSSASGISYDNTVSGLTADDVQGAIDEISGLLSWNLIGTIDTTSEALDVSGYTELYIVPFMQGTSPAFPMIMINAPGTACANSGREGSGYALDYKISISAESGATVLNTLSGWTSVAYRIYGR